MKCPQENTLKEESRMKTGFILVSLTLWLLGGWIGVVEADPDVKIGYVDIQRVIETSDKGKEFRDKVFQIRKQKEQILTGKQEEVNRLRQDFQQKAFTLSERARLDKEQELRQKELELRNLSETYRQEILLEGRKLQAIMFRDLSEVVAGIGEKEGFTAVLDKDTLLWASQSIDITDEVIKAYNAATE
jgi:outer membrane protein